LRKNDFAKYEFLLVVGENSNNNKLVNLISPFRGKDKSAAIYPRG
jgi:hypothetical protein